MAQDVGGAPAVGNVLGFSLLLSDRRALLRLDRRALGPGVHLSEYEAEVPGVTFPLKGATSAATFRHHRSCALGLRLTIEHRALATWLESRLVGSDAAGLRITDVELDLCARLEPEGRPGPCLYISARTPRGGFAWLLASLRIATRGRKMLLGALRLWLMGAPLLDPADVWAAVATLLGPRSGASGDVVLDPTRQALVAPFVAAGWKAPDVSQLQLKGVEFEPEGCTIVLSAAAGPPAGPIPSGAPPASDPAADQIGAVRDAIAQGGQDAVRQLVRLVELQKHHRPSRLAALKWLVESTRRSRVSSDGDGEAHRRCVDALRQWLDLAPNDARARRLLVEQLARGGAAGELARLTAAVRELPHDEVRAARLDLALAALRGDKLGDPDGARDLLEPLCGKAEAAPELEPLRRDALLALARAQRHDPEQANASLEAALRGEADAGRRAAARASVAEALAGAGHRTAALQAMRAAARDAPDDEAIVDAAIGMAVEVSDATTAAELIRIRLPTAEPARRAQLRLELATQLRQSDDPQAHTEALELTRRALEDTPAAAGLLALAADLEQQSGHPRDAANHLAQLIDSAGDGHEAAPHRLRRASLLAELGERDEAMACLEPALRFLTDAAEETALALAIGLAPHPDMLAYADRLVARAGADRAAHLLATRAAGADAGQEREVLLGRVAELASDPRPALHMLAEMSDPPDPQPWAALAQACAGHDDTAGEVAARRELALRLSHSGDDRGAALALERAVHLDPQDLRTQVAYGLALERSGHPREAGEAIAAAVEAAGLALEDGLQLDPRLGFDASPGALEQRAGELLASAGQAERAAEMLRLAGSRLPNESAQAIDAARIRAEALRQAGRSDEAVGVYRELSERLDGEQRARCLMQAAELADPTAASQLLEEAHGADPDNAALREQLLESLFAVDRVERAAALLWEGANAESAGREERAHALRRLLDLRVGDADPLEAVRHDDRLIELFTALVQLVPDDEVALLVVADHHAREGETEGAVLLWQRALDGLALDDPRGFDAASAVARHALTHGEPERARALVDRALRLRPDDRDMLTFAASVAAATGDGELAVRAGEGLLELAGGPGERAQLHLELARTCQRLGETAPAMRHMAQASQSVEQGSALHLQIAEAWLELARDRRTDPQHEAEARAELRRALGPDLPPVELRTEALLWAERLDDADRGIAILEEGLADRPTHDLLLSALKQICLGQGRAELYLKALERAVTELAAGEARDRMLVELALAAVELEEPARSLAALDRLSSVSATTPEMLDLRDWAIHNLGREDEELRSIEERLLVAPKDTAAIARLRRAKGDDLAVAEHLLALATGAPAPVAGSLSRQALRIASDRSDLILMLRAMRKAIDAGSVATAIEGWNTAQTIALETSDAAGVADLISLAAELAEAGHEQLKDTAQQLLDTALAGMPAAPRLHRLLWSTASGSEDPTASVLERIDAIIAGGDLPGRIRAQLYIGAADGLDRRAGAQLLQARADAEVDDLEAMRTLTDALEERGHFPEVLALLALQAERASDDARRVVALKRLAHVRGDILRDVPGAIGHLEAALELAPTDPDLLLPLLDQYFAQRDLGRAVELTTRVLEHVRMGDAAFCALAHRAADAAVAQGEHGTAAELLRQAAARSPSDRRTQDRLAELEAMQDDPVHRVKLLATIAGRQTGQARADALEERARLLIDPLERTDEAISDLETVVSDMPDRKESLELLRSLYVFRERWADLVALMEREFPRQHGAQRCETLREIARIYREQLLDLPRAEQALRLALDHLGDGDRDLAEEMRKELVADLEGQGRYVDLSIYLERALDPEITGQVQSAQLHSERAEMLIELARIYRGPLDDEEKAARIYERLESLARLPDEGLATLARAFHRGGRHEDLVRILSVRSRALGDANEVGRKAAVDQRIAELLEGPLGRPHEAANYYVDAYLADPRQNTAAGARARVLLSGTDAVANVRRRLLDRLPSLQLRNRPALLTLLGDVLSPHDDYENEAEARYREALGLDPEHATAREALGRLLARQGRLDAAVDPLMAAARHPDIEPQRAAEDAAIAARALLELGRARDAEQVLKDALQRAPESQRALLELARLYEREGRTTEHAIVLENLSQLPLSSMLGAEVAFRRGMLLQPAAAEDPYSPEAERARAYLLEAVSADGKHVAARQTLLELATARLEWSIVAHMHYLAIRELAPGPARALVHLDLAETYLDHLDDAESAMRNVESAIQQAPGDLVVSSRSGKLAARLPDPRRVAERFERIAASASDLDDGTRARLWLLAADLRMNDDDPAAAEQASKRVLDLREAPDDAAAAATRNLEVLADDDARDLRQQKSGLLRLLESEDAAEERLHILGRLREVGQSLGDTELVEWVSREQLELAHGLENSGADLQAASAALRDVFAERGDYEQIVTLYEQLADRAGDPERSADALVEAAKFSWHGLRAPARAAAQLRRALARHSDHRGALSMLGEVARDSDDAEIEAAVYDELARVRPSQRTPDLELQLGALAAKLGRFQDAATLLRPLCVQTHDSDLRYRALQELDTVLARVGGPQDRLPILRRYLEEAQAHRSDQIPNVAVELARTEATLGDPDGALRTCATGLDADPSHRGLVRLSAELFERREQWDEMAKAVERLANLTVDPADQAQLLTQAAQVRIEHQSTAADPRVASAARREARRLLQWGCELAPESSAPRIALLPLSFSEGRWDEVLEVAVDLRELAGDDEDSIILACVAEAYRHGHRTLARDLGYRHTAAARDRFLFPGMRQLLSEVAHRGPLPRLDALLAAGSALCGGRHQLSADLRNWAAGRPLQEGLALGLARLTEAEGDAELARSLYQIAAFMAPEGPVPALVARLPLPEPLPELDVAGSGPMEGRSRLRVTLALLRERLAGVSSPLLPLEDPPNEAVRTRLALAETIVAPWRRVLGLELPVAWSSAGTTVGVRNDELPTIVLGPGVSLGAMSELRFRLAYATAAVAMGFALIAGALITDTQQAAPTRRREPRFDLGDLLDALGQVANPGHVPTGVAAQRIADHLASAGVRAVDLDAEHRAGLAEELAFWLTSPDGIERLGAELRRAQLLFATRLCGQLDGALMTLAGEHGFIRRGRPDPVATLRTDDAHWLLRGLGLY